MMASSLASHTCTANLCAAWCGLVSFCVTVLSTCLVNIQLVVTGLTAYSRLTGVLQVFINSYFVLDANTFLILFLLKEKVAKSSSTDDLTTQPCTRPDLAVVLL